MAEGTLFDIAARIIESSGSLARKEIGLFWGATVDELVKLKNTVSTIQAVLLDAEVQGAVNRQIRDWLEKLKDVIYDADDLLDGFSTDYLLREIKMAKKVRIFFSKSNQTVYNLKMGHKIKAIRQKLDAIVNDRTKFHLMERPVEIGVGAMKRDDNHSFSLTRKVIGREDDKKNILKRLVSDSNIIFNVGILPIIGIGGLGKTTLAKFIFYDELVEELFQLRMWVCVSESFDVKKVVEKILESARRKLPESVEMDTLVHNLQKEIGGKKYLLVLDDVWNEEVEKWNQLKKVLEIGARGSRILITTRSAKVAKITGTMEPYSLQGLDSNESRCLFKAVAFENGQEPVNSRKVEVGKEIVGKCLGVPLVIETIGRLLSLENSEPQWVSFNQKLPRTKENEILPTLKLSYDQLPSRLKQCFAYCSIFPKGYVMKKSKLINLWIAQGFIKPCNQHECLEDVGHEYFMDLVWRSFFQEVERDDLGNVIRIKMHDLMHDLAMSMAGSSITRLEFEETIGDRKTRHVSVAENIDFSIVIPTSSSKARRIRTLFSYGKFEGGLKKSETCEAIFSSLKSLRVLDLHGKGLHIVPSSICRLKHLRYLDLSRNYQIEKLPDLITRLQNLHTLRVSYCDGLKELPRGIMKLVNLRHLYNGGCKNLTSMPCGLGQLTNLQTLSKFVVHFDSAPKDSGRLSELNRLDSLRLGELKISELRHGEDVALDCKNANLKKKEHLQILRLRWSTKNVDAHDEKALEGLEPHPNLKKLYIDYYGGVRVPMWLLSLSNLIHLSVGNCRKLKYLPPLSQLRSLKSLYLSCLDEIEYVSDCGDNNEFPSSSSSALIEFFPSLEVIRVIRLQWCPNLKGWWRTSDPSPPSYFPRLSNLTIRECPMLTSLPMFPHLQEDLYLRSASWKPMQQTMMKNVNLSTTVEASSSSSIPIVFPSAPLCKLKEIRLMHIGDIETLPEDGLQNLISIKFLEISDCPRLKSLSQGIQYLTALHELKLIDCPVLDLGNDELGMQWKGLKSLISLEFHSIPKLVSLPLGLQHVTTLRQFQILNCSSFIAIPEWISNWASLEAFTINACSGLTSLPKAMEGLSSLKRLTIYDCPILVQRCEKERGEDWHKIAHIRKRNVYRYGNMI